MSDQRHIPLAEDPNQKPTGFSPDEKEATEHEIPLNPEFNLERLRLSQDFQKSLGVKKVLLTIPVRRPDRQCFIRVREGEEWRIATALLELKEERETYLVDPSLWNEIDGVIVRKMLFTAMNRHGVLFLWPVRLPRSDGRLDAWNQSALEAAERAEQGWVSVRANMSLGAYEVFTAVSDQPEPEWPAGYTFQQLVEIAFKDRFITSADHPVLRRLRGEL